MKIIAITGPSGAGKTTVAKKLAKQLKSFVNIDVDHLKHMNPNAFNKVIDEDGEEDWPYSAWELLGENAALLAKNFLDHGYDVIINGFLEVESWKEIEKHLKIDHKFLLLPDPETNVQRDAGRTEEVRMRSKAVKRGQDYFRTTDYYSDFTLIDTSDLSLYQTVEQIIEKKYIMSLEINPNIEIKDSPIQGKGLFTKIPIKKGEKVWISKGEEPYNEKIYTDEEFKEFQRWCIENGKEWDAVANEDGTHTAAISEREKHPGNYGNHSCDPNMSKDLIALRDVEADEELTGDYTLFSTKDWEMECSCGAKNCTGVVKGLL